MTDTLTPQAVSYTDIEALAEAINEGDIAASIALIVVINGEDNPIDAASAEVSMEDGVQISRLVNVTNEVVDLVDQAVENIAQWFADEHGVIEPSINAINELLTGLVTAEDE
jgi:hypothetical protein